MQGTILRIYQMKKKKYKVYMVEVGSEHDLTDDALIKWYHNLMRDVTRSIKEAYKRTKTSDKMREWCIKEMEKVQKGKENQ